MNEELPVGFHRQGEANTRTVSLMLKALLCP